MSDGPVKRTIPVELREKLLEIALQTDVVAEHRGIETWRVAAVSAARWLIRVAAESEDIPRGLQATLRQVAAAAHKISGRADHVERRTKSGELRIELAKFLDEDEI